MKERETKITEYTRAVCVYVGYNWNLVDAISIENVNMCFKLQ